jgi:hypothetical protein
VNSQAKRLSRNDAWRQIRISADEECSVDRPGLRQAQHVRNNKSVHGFLLALAVSGSKAKFEIVKVIDRPMIQPLSMLARAVVPIHPKQGGVPSRQDTATVGKQLGSKLGEVNHNIRPYPFRRSERGRNGLNPEIASIDEYCKSTHLDLKTKKGRRSALFS